MNLRSIGPQRRERSVCIGRLRVTQYANVARYRVEFSTPNRGSDDYAKHASPMPSLGGASAQPLRLRDFLIHQPIRTVLLHRSGVPGLSIEDTAELLGVLPETVKTRLHRARSLVRKALDDQIGPVLLDASPFAGRRCESLTTAVMTRLGFPD